MEEFCGSVLWVSYRSNRLWRNSFYLLKYEHMFCGVELRQSNENSTRFTV
jgi:hypothetical protein